jgi:hypothetical protein
MSHFAKVLDGKVIQVIVAEPEFFNTFVDTSPGQWIQTSYNTKGGIHYQSDGATPSGGVALRGNYAGVGHTYDVINDVFYAPKPYASWILNQTTWTWEAPTPYPQDDKVYRWDEATTSWKEIE